MNYLADDGRIEAIAHIEAALVILRPLAAPVVTLTAEQVKTIEEAVKRLILALRPIEVRA